MTKPPNCPYCGATAVLTTGAEVYPHRPALHGRNVWRCRGCRDSWVGCHLPQEVGGFGDGTVPLGTLANEELRQWRSTVHTFLDKIWRSGTMTRSETYAWLGQQLQVEPDQCHVAMFTIEQCQAAMRLLAERED